MKQEEEKYGNAKTFTFKLAHLDVSTYLEKVHKGVSENELKEYVLEKQSQIPEFFTKWELYQKNRKAKASIIETKVRVLSSEHRKFLKNFVGGIFGGVISNLIFKKLEALMDDDDNNSSENNDIDDMEELDIDDD